MAEKRRPGIPHETLEWIATQAGGTIDRVPVDRTLHVRLAIAGKTYQAENNTALLIEVFKSIGEQSSNA